MNIPLFLCLLFGLQIACFIAAKASSRSIKNQDDYFLAGKALKFFPLMMTCVAIQVGGGLVLGASEEAFVYGWQVLFYPLGASLGLLLLGSGIGQRLAKFNVPTVAQIFEKAYGSPFLKKIASLLSILSLFMILVAQFIASSKFMVTLGLESKWIFIGFWAIVIAYTSLGGLKAVVATDVIQASFFITTFIICFIFAISSNDFSLISFVQRTYNHEAYALDSAKLCGWLLMPLFFMLIEQDMAQRCFAADAPKTLGKAAMCSAFFVFAICMIPIAFGVMAFDSGIIVPKGSSVLLVAIEQTTNPLITACAGSAILAAIISTADSLINAISSNITQDFGLSFIKNKEVRSSQIITTIIAITAIFFSFYLDSVVGVLIQSYELCVSCLFAPIFAALFKKGKGNILSASLAVFFGVTSFIVFRVYPIEYFREIWSILLSFTGFFLGEIVVTLTKQKLTPIAE